MRASPIRHRAFDPKAVVGFILLPPGRLRSQDGFGSIATSEKLARAKGMQHWARRRRSQDHLAAVFIVKTVGFATAGPVSGTSLHTKKKVIAKAISCAPKKG